MPRQLKILSGEGNATAALVADTITNIAVVTLPTDPGYEYDVTIAVDIKASSTSITYAHFMVGGNLSTYAATPAGGQHLANTATWSGVASSNPQELFKFKAGPGQAITCPMLSNRADTYYLHYTYVGRKVIETAAGGF